jgi:hypothetical protein
MKYLVLLSLAVMLSNTAYAEDRKACHTIGGRQVCKTVKIHKKAEKVTQGDPSAPEARPAKKKK